MFLIENYTVKNKEGQSDQDLLLEMKDNSRHAFDCLYHRYWNKLLDAAYSKLGDADEAQELVQQLFVDLYRNRESVQVRTTLEGYLLAALKYKVIDRYRKIMRQTEKMDTWQSFTSQDVPSPDALLEIKETNEKLIRIINTLPEKCKEVFHLSRFEHQSHQEIAQQLNISESTVKKHIHKALFILRKEMKTDFLFCLLATIFISK
ncbi:RNA polymerase sigma-70 factor [Sphingobacterium sp.]|uniref:RNA polymerase sigma factor n=1 Tax=Sphingobacterium sp. TaxID=341027 RepID=UPI002899965D|nr:RNA polymerase sigma-70 factor [Sphingobacterium sp.]